MRLYRIPKLPAERFPTYPPSAGAEAGVTNPGAVACLEPFLYQQMRQCARCGGEQIFIAMYECSAGRVGFCMRCGEEKLVPFSRETEAA